MLLTLVFLCQPDQELLEKHYEDLKSKSFFPGLIKYMKSGPVCAMVSGLDLLCKAYQMLV